MNEKIIEFLLLQIQLTQSRRITTLYRGDNLENIYDRFGIFNDKSEYNKKELLKRIFLIGDKAKYFYENEILKLNQYPRDIELTDESDDILNKIFLKFNSATRSDKEYIENYFRRNSLIFNYFSEVNNRKKFIESIKATKKQLSYRNYYLKILHQLYFIEYRNNTHFVSTSFDKDVTKPFANDNGIIIHCWQPNCIHIRKKFEKFNLPRQQKLPFEDQKEFSFTAGILPHYISAVEFIAEKNIFFNPNIIENTITSSTFFNGLEIDQEDFVEIIVKTQFRKYFTKVGIGYNEYNNSR